MKTPTIKEIRKLIIACKKEIGDDYRSMYTDPDEKTPSMDITVGSDAIGCWGFQTGDNSFTGGAYGFRYWGTAVIDRKSNSTEVARDIVNQIAEAQSYDKE
jgi:hypothetical protein